MRRSLTLLPAALSVALSAALAMASPTPSKSLEAVRLSEPIKLDGRMSEAIWEEAPVADRFTADWPDFGEPSKLKTEVRVLYDNRYLYVGARMLHPQGGKAVVGRVHRRDQWSLSDWFSVCLDSMHDRGSAVAFQVNPAGVQRDAIIYGDTSWDHSWDGVWESAVMTDDGGWTAELKIPLSLLRMRAGRGSQTWGINFQREANGPVRESSIWELTPRGVNAFVSRFPELRGLDGLVPQPRREWIPFVGVQRKFRTSASYDDRGTTLTAGLDAHLSLSTFSQLDLTVRPDFGQVEADQATLNLGTYETWFPEKRPFFLDGMDIFQVAGSSLFYSRRIGAGLSNPWLNDGETLIDRPQLTDVAGAAKYTGKFENGLNIGVLGASVETSRARIRLANGTEVDRILSPYTTFGVARAMERLDDRGSYIGGFASYMDQSRYEDANGREAAVVAADGVYKSQDRGTTIDATISKSQAGVKGEENSGHRERFSLNRQWKSGWWANLGTENATRAYNPNDMGFMGRADQQRVDGSLGRNYDSTWRSFRNWNWSLGGTWARNQEGRVFQRSFWSNAGTNFTDFSSIYVSAGASLPADNDRELRTFDDPVRKYLHYGTLPWVGLEWNSPDNKPWCVSVNLNRGWREGGPSRSVNLFQSIKLSPSLELQLNTNSALNQGEKSYLETQDSTPIVGLRKLSSFNQTLRLAYAFSPNLTLQFFSQWLEANWNYRDLMSYVDDHTLIPGATSAQTAFSDRMWNANLITRWEFKPGSTVYFVYTHATSTDSVINDRATISPNQDLSMLTHMPSDDSVMFKLSYLFR